MSNIRKAIPMELHMTIAKALERSPDLKVMYESDPQVKELIDQAYSTSLLLYTLKLSPSERLLTLALTT